MVLTQSKALLVMYGDILAVWISLSGPQIGNSVRLTDLLHIRVEGKGVVTYLYLYLRLCNFDLQ